MRRKLCRQLARTPMHKARKTNNSNIFVVSNWQGVVRVFGRGLFSEHWEAAWAAFVDLVFFDGVEKYELFSGVAREDVDFLVRADLVDPFAHMAASYMLSVYCAKEHQWFSAALRAAAPLAKSQTRKPVEL